MRSKVFGVLLVFCMLLGCISGCGVQKQTREQNTITPEPSEPIVLTVYSEFSSFKGEQTGWMAQLLKEKFNVILDIVVEWDYESEDTDEVPCDLVFMSGSSHEKAVAQGALYDWEKDGLLTEHGYYIEQHMADALDANRDSNGGKLYGLPAAVASSPEDHEPFFYTWDLRWDLYKELGYPEYHTLEEFVEVLADMKEICPVDDQGQEVYAASLWSAWDKSTVRSVFMLAAAYYGYDEWYHGLYDPETGEFHDVLEENGAYLSCLKFYNDLYQRNLLDPASLEQTYEDALAKIAAGGTLFSVVDYAGSEVYNPTHTKSGSMMLSWAPQNATPLVYGEEVYGERYRICSIGANTEYPKLCMEIINWLCTPEGMMTCNYGPKGLCWDYDEDGYAYLTEFGVQIREDGTTEMIGDYAGTGAFYDGCFQANCTPWSIYAQNPDGNNEIYDCTNWKNNVPDVQGELEQDWRDYTGSATTQEYLGDREYVVAYGNEYYRIVDEGNRPEAWAYVDELIKDYSWQAIYAETDEEFEQIVAEMKKELDANGYAECIAWSEEQAQIRRQCELEVLE